MGSARTTLIFLQRPQLNPEALGRETDSGEELDDRTGLAKCVVFTPPPVPPPESGIHDSLSYTRLGNSERGFMASSIL